MLSKLLSLDLDDDVEDVFELVLVFLLVVLFFLLEFVLLLLLPLLLSWLGLSATISISLLFPLASWTIAFVSPTTILLIPIVVLPNCFALNVRVIISPAFCMYSPLIPKATNLFVVVP